MDSFAFIEHAVLVAIIVILVLCGIFFGSGLFVGWLIWA